MMRLVVTSFFALATSASAASPKSQPITGPLGSWNILGPEFQKEPSGIRDKLRDGFSFEWDYHMIWGTNETTGETAFHGIAAYVLMDPRGRLEFGGDGLVTKAVEDALAARFGVTTKGDDGLKLVPGGGNVAFVGKWGDEAPMSTADFVNFDRSETVASNCPLLELPPNGSCKIENTRQMSGTKKDDSKACSHGCDASLSVEAGGLRMTGSTEHARWNLTVTQDWQGRPGVPAHTGDDWQDSLWPIFRDEFWTVKMPWPRTIIKGTLERRNADGSFQGPLRIDGHGYREDSHGQWGFSLEGGWVFAIHSRRHLDANGNGNVLWMWQAYYAERVGKLDHLDVNWCEGGEKPDGSCVELHEAHFNASNLKWFHDGPWQFNTAAATCTPTDARIIGEVAEDGGIRVDATLTINADQTPILHNAPASIFYVINEWLPTIEGTIERCSWTCDASDVAAAVGAPQGWCRCDWKVVTKFSGIAGGELSMLRSKGFIDSLITHKPVPLLDEPTCTSYGKHTFQAAMHAPNAGQPSALSHLAATAHDAENLGRDVLSALHHKSIFV